MTNFDFNGKISFKNDYLLDKQKFSKGECTKAHNFMLPMQCEFQGTCQVNHKMRELHTDLRTTTNYLIQFFYATGQVYSCSRTKLGKLLSIVAFIYAQKDIKLFDESIYRYNGCGTAIKELNSFTDTEIYVPFSYSDNGEFITGKTENIISDEIELEYKDVPEQLKNTVKEVFQHFGSFSPSMLGMCINPIVDGLEYSENGEINLSDFQKLKRTDFDNVENNLELIEFLFKDSDNNE